MPKLTKNIEIASSPEKLSAFLFDRNKMNEITQGYLEVEPTSKGPVGVGSTMHYVGKSGRSTAEWDMEITEFEKNRKVAARTIGASKFKLSSSHTLEPTAKGTKWTYTMDYELPYSLLGKIVDKLKIGKDMEKKMGAMMEKVKKALEA